MPKGEREKLLGQRWRALPEAKRARYKAAGQARPTPRHPPSPYTGAHRSHHPRPASEPPSTSPQPPLKRSPTSPLPIPPTLALTTRRPGCPARARVIVPALRPPRPPNQPRRPLRHLPPPRRRRGSISRRISTRDRIWTPIWRRSSRAACPPSSARASRALCRRRARVSQRRPPPRGCARWPPLSRTRTPSPRASLGAASRRASHAPWVGLGSVVRGLGG